MYRLIANDTPDVFLNTISFDKARMLEAFVGATDNLRKFTRLPSHDAQWYEWHLQGKYSDMRSGSRTRMSQRKLRRK